MNESNPQLLQRSVSVGLMSTELYGNVPKHWLPAGEWLDKLQRYTQASELVVKPNPKKASEPEVAVQAEGERLLRAISPQVLNPELTGSPLRIAPRTLSQSHTVRFDMRLVANHSPPRGLEMCRGCQ